MKAFKIILSIVLSIVFFAVYFAFANVIVVRMALSKDNIENFVTNLKVDEINIGGFIGDTKDIDNDANMNNYLRDLITNSGINDETTNKIINNDDFNNMIKNYIANVITADLYKQEAPKLSSVEIINVLNENDIYLSAEVENDIKKTVSEINNEMNFNISKEKIYRDYSITDVFEIINCKTLLYISIITIMVFYLLFALINWSFKKPILYMAIPMLISGIFLGLIYFGSSALINFFEFNNYTFILNNIFIKYLYLASSSIIISIGLIILNSKIKESKTN